jgi:sugar phosphate permease
MFQNFVIVIGVYSVCGIIGTVLSGFLSDKLLKGSRNVPVLIFGICNTIAIMLFVFVPKGYFAMDIFSMILFGLSIGALICYLGGMMTVDIAPKKASCAALGVVGIASYIGVGIQDILSGKRSWTALQPMIFHPFVIFGYLWRHYLSSFALVCGKEQVKPKRKINSIINITINNLITKRRLSEKS